MHPNNEKGTKVTKASRAGMLLIVFGLFVALSSAPAAAKQIRLFTGSFGATTSVLSNPYPLSSGAYGPSSVAVDDTSGDVYVTDQGNRRVEMFTASGEFVLMFGKDVNRTAVESSGSEAEQNVCTAASGDACQAGARASSPGAFDPANTGGFEERGLLFVTVDNSSGPSKGDVYVADSSDHLITKFNSSGKVVEGWGNNAPGGAPNGQLNGVSITDPFAGFLPLFEGIAVDSSGNLWLAELERLIQAGAVVELRRDSSFVEGWTTGEKFNGFGLQDDRAGIAIDSTDNIYASPNKYDAAGNWIGRINEQDLGMVVDPSSGELYAAGAELPGEPKNVIERYDASCKPIRNNGICTAAESFGSGHLSEARGLAIDSSNPTDTIYAADAASGQIAAFSIKTVPDVETRNASNFTTTAAVLNGTVDPAGVAPTECFFEWGQAGKPYEHTSECEPGTVALGGGDAPAPVQAHIAGLQPGNTYHFRLAAANANDVNEVIDEPSLGADREFGPPLLESSSVADVSATAATLQAQANPNGVDTQVRFEYGIETGVYEHDTHMTELGSDGASKDVAQPIQGLEPITTYHYRVIFVNVLGTVESGDQVFTTQGVATSGLPDTRAWELVSPPDKNGIPLEAISREGGDIQADADGGGLAYIAKGAIDAGPAGNRSPAETQLLARRGLAGWSTQDISTRHQAPSGVVPGRLSEYLFFATNLSLGVVEPAGATPLSPEAGERTPYLRQDNGEYTPLVTAGNVPAGTKFGGREYGSEWFGEGITFAAATPDLSHVVIESPAVLTTPEFVVRGNQITILYEWSGGVLSLVSQIPTAADTLCGSEPACVPAAATGLGSNVGSQSQVRHAISADGSRVVFASGVQGQHLFLRETVKGETLQLDALQGGPVQTTQPAIFQDASADGSRVFFTDSERLTANSTASDTRPDLYMCEIGEVATRLSCVLKDLTVDHNTGESADVQGEVLGTDEAGIHTYFVAKGVLTSGTNGFGASAEAGANNLYEYDAATEATMFVAVLSDRDERDWAGNATATARISPNGRWLAFMSQRPLTGYDNRDATSGQPDEEVFLYHAAEGGLEKLVCASCNPTGGRPAGVLDQATGYGMLVDRVGNWDGRWLAASIPGWTRVSAGPPAFYQSRYLSDSGRLFFDASDALVSADSNGSEDVYQYEPPGVGGCTGASRTFGAVSGGCVDLISSGTSSEESAFLDASESGNDVFFLTAARLASQDVDSAIDVYDAHVCSAESSCPPAPPPPPPACEGDACQSPASAPDDPTPGSLTFQGPGNLTFAAPVAKPKARTLDRARKLARALKVCRKKSKKKRPPCEKQAQRAYGPVGTAKKSNRRGK